MSRKNTIVKGRAVHRIREGSRLMRTHETMVDLISGRHTGASFMDVLSSGLFDLDFLRGYEQSLEDDLIYSDEDDDDDDDDICHHYAMNKPLQPHPRIRQLTDEEAEKHAKELIAKEELRKALIAEEERRKERTERNKRKKLRKKEKKRLEKENAAKENLLEEEQEKSDSSENQEEEKNISEKVTEETLSLESTKTETQTEETTLCDQNNVDITEEKNSVQPDTKKEGEENHVEIVKTEEKEHVVTINKEELEEDVLEIKEKGNKKDSNNSVNASSSKSVQEETSTQRSARERKKEKNKVPEIQQEQSKEKKPQVVEKPKEIQKKEEKQEPNKEQKTEPTVDEFVRKSRELAGIGNRLAASGQYEMAVKYFTDAIKYNPQEFKLFGNRSLCYERMQQFENALRDADLALCMQPNWIKGLFRKGKALCGLKRYHEASLIYKEVLNLESSSVEAMQELKRAQTLHLMEMGFSWGQSSEALKTHATLEEAIDALFSGNHHPAPAEASAVRDMKEQPEMQKEENGEEEEEWTNVGPLSRSRAQQVKESEALGKVRSKSQSPTPNSRNSTKPELFSIWVGSLAPTVTYITLHELFSRAGTVHGIKMLLEHQCAFVNYARKEDCDRAIQCINGMVLEGAPLAVRYPNRAIHAAMSKPANADPRSGPYKKECFFWRTTGCTRTDCTFKHVPENKNIDKDKFTSRLGNANM